MCSVFSLQSAQFSPSFIMIRDNVLEYSTNIRAIVITGVHVWISKYIKSSTHSHTPYIRSFCVCVYVCACAGTLGYSHACISERFQRV